VFPRSFFARDALAVAADLLGARLQRGGVSLRITEVEAYRWPGDTANHGRHGRTERNAPLWGPPGTVYIYLCYGVHHLLNLVTGADGEAAAVLVRACEPLAGLRTIRRRRGGLSGPALLNGPGKVGAALGLDLGWNGHAVHAPGGLEVHRGPPPERVLRGPRIGVDYASPEDRAAPWRLAVGESTWVGYRSRLQ
jgi:DNA-3-methyladenine glycosylase